MASLRKKHRELTDELPPERRADAPVPEAAAAPDPATPSAAADIFRPADTASARPLEDEEKVAMRKRLQEMEDAQQRVQQLEAGIAQQAQIAHQLQSAPPPQQPSVETIIANAPLPESAKAWLLAHPDYITDAAKNAQMQEMHYVAKWQSGGEQFTDRYFQQMESLLGVQPMTDEVPMNGSRPFHVPAFASEPARPAAPAPAPPAPPRQVTVSPVSAPPHREVPSLSNGRRPSQSNVRLSPDQREIAWAARSDLPRDQAEELYAQNLMRMQKLKASGAISD
jgi:hypothetical protein